MQSHPLRVYRSKESLPKTDQLAYKFAQLATDPVEVEPAVTEMLINRLIDNASVAIAAINRGPVKTARLMALAHPRSTGATIFGLPSSLRFDCEWAAWANGTAVRELDFHDTFLAADYSHPGDNIPPILAVAQQTGRTGKDLIRGFATGYEIQVNLVKAICLHEFKKDHIAHLGPSAAAGIGTLLGLSTDIVYQAIQQALHVTFTTRQSRKGEISSWKAFAPAHAGKLAIEAVDRCMRGEKAPSPIYEGEDSVIAWMLSGPNGKYNVPIPKLGEPKRAILETYTKEHSAEYQAQALIDLAFKVRDQIKNWADVESIVITTSHHTHFVIGTGSGDPQKFDPKSSRETLDHSIMYIFAVALQDGSWHHVKSYAPERAKRPDTVELWNKISTQESSEWTKRYHDADPAQKAFGAHVSIRLKNGTKIEDELARANAHPAGARPFERAQYIQKFETLTDGILERAEQQRFLELAQSLPKLGAKELLELNPLVPESKLEDRARNTKGIF